MEENRTWGGEHGSDREFHQSREYQQDAGREYGCSSRQYRDTNHEEEKRKKKWNKISRYLLGTVSGAVVIAGAAFYEKAPVIELTELEKNFLQEVEQEFQENDLDGVLEMLTGREISYAPDGRVKIEWENQLADIYHEISDKAAWNPEERLAILMGDDISVVPEGDGIGFCFDGGKLYYGQLKDGFPDGTGICYVVVHNYYSYSQGGWKEGYANDWMVSRGGYFERKENQDYFSAWETREGFYNAGIAEGTVTLTFDTLNGSEEDGYDSEMTETAAYEVSNGQIVMDEHWKKNEYDYYELYDEAGKIYVFDFDEYHLREYAKVEVEWLPVEASGFHQMPDEDFMEEEPVYEGEQQNEPDGEQFSFHTNELAVLEQLEEALMGGEYETAVSIVRGEEYIQLMERIGGWRSTGRMLNVMPDNGYGLEYGVNGEGFCMGPNIPIIYYGELKNGLPDGYGVSLEVYVPETDYVYTAGDWKAGRVNGYAENASVREDQGMMYRNDWYGHFTNDLADGVIHLRKQTNLGYSVYSGPVDIEFDYTCEQGEVVKDDYWERSEEYDTISMSFPITSEFTYTINETDCRTKTAVTNLWVTENDQ